MQIVAIDPAIAALIGVSSAERVSYQKELFAERCGPVLQNRTPRHDFLECAAHMLTPGNGLFLTSTSTNAGVGYNYTGLRHWAISAGAELQPVGTPWGT